MELFLVPFMRGSEFDYAVGDPEVSEVCVKFLVFSMGMAAERLGEEHEAGDESRLAEVEEGRIGS